ncbi:hypothetical protein ENBRE01_2828 [Enteropsectra breve]|nr:hypothetical protein ENBRE01_2828 [Enteropsectra breve]
MAGIRRTSPAYKKLEIVRYDELNSNRAAGPFYEIDESLMRRCRQNKDALMAISSQKRSMHYGKVYWPELEIELKAWIIF